MDIMKAIVVIDIPERCSDCPMANSGTSPSDDWNCTVTWVPRNGYMCRKKIKLEDIDTIQSWCPLKTIPNKLDWKVGYVRDKNTCEIFNKNYVDGYNECIDEILGDTE